MDELKEAFSTNVFTPYELLKIVHFVADDFFSQNPNATEKERKLRTDSGKLFREARDIALFCAGISHINNSITLIYLNEQSNYDCIFFTDSHEGMTPRKLQLKELTPDRYNRYQTINDTIAGLQKYGEAKDLVVAIKHGKIGTIDYGSLIVPPTVKVKEIWIYGKTAANQYTIMGDIVNPPHLRGAFSYPDPELNLV